MNPYLHLREHITREVAITDHEWQIIEQSFTHIRLKKNQYLVQAGAYVQNDHWVASGCLKACFTDPDGKEYILQFAREDWWISDYNALFKGEKSKMDIYCLEACEVLALSNPKRQLLYRDIPAIQTFFLHKITNAFVALQNRTLSLMALTPSERYNEFLRLYPDFIQRIPKKYIAQYLGVSRETLSRLHS